MNWSLEVEYYDYNLWSKPEATNESARLYLGCSDGWTVQINTHMASPSTLMGPIIKRPSKLVYVHIEFQHLPIYLDMLRSGPVRAGFSDTGAATFSLSTGVISTPTTLARSGRRSSARGRTRSRTGR